MPVERRRQPRQKLYSPEYFDMDADNGGVLIDLSESGAGFQAVSSIERDQVVTLSFSLGSGYRIEAQARITWVGSNRNSGGASFLSLREDSGSILREWLAKSAGERHPDAPASITNESPSAVPLNEPIPSPAAELMAAETGAAIFGQAGDAANGADPIAAGEWPYESGPAHPPDTGAVARSTTTVAEPGSPSAGEPSQAHSATPAKSRQTSPSQPAATNVSVRWPTSMLGGAAPQSRTAKPPTQRHDSRAHNPQEGLREDNQASFSAVPSIGAWSKSEARSSASPSSGLRSPGALLPPDAGPIFSRRTGTLQEASEGRGKKVALVIILLLITAGIVWYRYYPHPWLNRQAVGAAVVRVGDFITGTPSSASTSAKTSATTSATAPGQSSRANSQSTPGAAPAGKPSAAAHEPTGTNAGATPTTTPAGAKAAEKKAEAANGDASSAPQADARQASEVRNAAPEKPSTSPPLQAATPPGTDAQTQTKRPGYLPSPGTESAGVAKDARATSTAHLGSAEYARAEQYLNGKSPDPAEAAQWLWRSLEAGNTDAALPLADLYLQGKGVNQSCVQARVLLNAAAAKGNAEAIHKLSQLPENCE